MEAPIQKLGNSLGLRITAKVVSQFSLKEGKAVDIRETMVI
jgi:antitoxin component of MazEF toxin-antitoxin module